MSEIDTQMDHRPSTQNAAAELIISAAPIDAGALQRTASFPRTIKPIPTQGTRIKPVAEK